MLKRISISIFEEDLTFLDTVHEERSEAIRSIIKKLRKKNVKEDFYKYIQFVTLGVVSLGIAMSLDPFSIIYLVLIGLGTGMSLFGVVSLMIIANRQRNTKANKQGDKDEVAA